MGKEKVAQLTASSVTVVGIGAVGAYAVEGLARAGVGRLRLVDFDVIKPTNMNRHPYALLSTIGRAKVEAARDRIRDIDPACAVEPLALFAGPETFDRILDNAPDLVIDAIDSLNPKVQLLAACYTRAIPVISSMGAALRTDAFSVKTADLFDTKHCPLAQHLRQRLRRLGVGRGIVTVYSDQLQKKFVPRASPDTVPGEDTCDRGRKRQKLGSLPTVTGIFGLAIAHCAIERLCGGIEKR